MKWVTSLITVKPKAEVAEVKAKIEAAFERNAAIDSKRVHVEVGVGVVTLSGNVRSWAESAAWAAPGVFKVVNELTIAL